MQAFEVLAHLGLLCWTLDSLPALQSLLATDHFLVVWHFLCPSHNDCDAAIVVLRSSRTTKHLHDLKVSVLFETTGAIALVGHCVLDDDHVTRQIHTDSKSRRATNDADLAL